MKNRKMKKGDKSGNNGDEQKSDKISSDVLGSWTGIPENEYDKPVQDADDL